MIILKDLPKEIRDRLELKEDTESTFFRALEEDYTNICLETLKKRKNPLVQHSYLSTIYGEQGSGKSFGGLFISGYLDDDFNEENIYFDYNELVNVRHKLKPNSAYLIDEQSSPFGVDSHRVTIILSALKEKLRKRSIHMCYCSPTLKPEYVTSMYVLESMFVDENTCNSYFAYKTNDLNCLGYVKFPHPLTVMSKKLLRIYEKMKDEHLDVLMNKSSHDPIEDKANEVMKHKYFVNMEEKYLEKRGYIPNAMLIQIVSIIYPDFKGSEIVYAIADRIKLIKQLEGEWEIHDVKSGGK